MRDDILGFLNISSSIVLYLLINYSLGLGSVDLTPPVLGMQAESIYVSVLNCYQNSILTFKLLLLLLVTIAYECG